MGSAAYREKSRTALPVFTLRWPGPQASSAPSSWSRAAWVEDNLWYLKVSETDPIIVGVSGRLDPYKPEFGEFLGRFRKNPLYRAIRASRFYTNTDGKVTLDPVAVENLKLLAEADLAHDTANPSMPLMTANVMLADAIPTLRIIMDHLPSFDPTPGKPGGLRGRDQGNGGATEHLRQVIRGVSSACGQPSGRIRLHVLG